MSENTPGGPAQAPHEPAGDTAGGFHEGPRVTRDEVRDLGRLRRTVDDKYVAGVAGGLARHLDIDPVIVRVAFVVLTFFGGAGLIIYAACWLLVPEETRDHAAIDLDVRSRTIALIGVGILAGLALIGDLFGEGPGGWVAWPLVIVGAVAWLILSQRDRRRAARTATYPGYGPAPAAHYSPPPGTAPLSGSAPPPWTPTAPVSGSAPPPWTSTAPPPPRRPSDPRRRGPILFWFTLALAALSLGVLGIIDAAGGPITGSAYPALALGIVAAMLLLGSFFGRAGGLIPVGIVLALGLAVATTADRVDGDRIMHRPGSASELSDSYEMTAGEMVIDLTEIRDLAALDERTLELDGSFGRIEVILPAGLDFDLEASFGGGGEVSALGQSQSGWGFSYSAGLDRGDVEPRLNIDAELMLGEIEVVTR